MLDLFDGVAVVGALMVLLGAYLVAQWGGVCIAMGVFLIWLALTGAKRLGGSNGG